METVFSTGRWFWPGYLWTGFTERGGGGDGARREREVQARYFRPFFVAYFFYYAGYCVFSSFIVLFLTERGYSAAVCGVITSLTLLTNLLMEPVGGYLTDTYLSARSYLTVCIGVITGVCLLATLLFSIPAVCVLMGTVLNDST